MLSSFSYSFWSFAYSPLWSDFIILKFGLFIFSLLICRTILYIFCMNPLSDTCKELSLSMVYLFFFFNHDSEEQQFLILMKVGLSFLYLLLLCPASEIFAYPQVMKIFSYVSLLKFDCFSFIFWSKIKLKWIFEYDMRYFKVHNFSVWLTNHLYG